MKVEEAIRGRRSVRAFTSRKLCQEDIEKILEAAIWAPSGLNNQPWKFKVVREADSKQKLSQFTKYGQVVREAAVLICVFLDTGASYHREKDIMAVGAALQNMLLQAYELGIGSCWLGEIMNQKEALQRYLAVPAGLDFMAAVALGYPAGSVPEGERRALAEVLV